MIPYIITFFLISFLTYMFYKNSKSFIRLREETGVKSESVYDIRFHTSQLLGKWGTKIYDVESHKDFHRMSNLALNCEVKTPQGNIIWVGDIDINLDKNKFTELSKKINKTITVEVDGRVVLRSSDGNTDVWSVDVMSDDKIKNRNNRLDKFLKNSK